jgi:ParB family transcriptional regulator, chromosome partitioning protein
MGKFNKLLTALQADEAVQDSPEATAGPELEADPGWPVVSTPVARPSTDADSSPRQFLPHRQILRDPNQVRKYFDPEKLQGLAQTIAEEGVLEDLAVYELDDQPGYYQLVFGERRYRASELAGLKQVPVRVIPKPDAKKLLKLQLIENKHHEDLNPIEEVEGALALLAAELEQPVEAVVSLLKQMDNDVRRSSYNVMGQPTADVVIKTLDGLNIKWRSFVLNQLPLLGLSEDILEPIRQGKIEYTKALTIARLRDPEQRQLLLDEAINQNLSIRGIRERIKQLPPSQAAASAQVSTAYSEFELSGVVKRLNSIGKQLKRSKVWQDRHKQERLKLLLQEIETILKA